MNRLWKRLALMTFFASLCGWGAARGPNYANCWIECPVKRSCFGGTVYLGGCSS
jgi:hypothetical protein